MSQGTRRNVRIVAWMLGVAGILACIVAARASVAFGAPDQFLIIYLVGILMGLLGALVASREPRNAIGWLMGATSLATSLTHLPVGYGYAALVGHHGAWPLGSAAVWLGAWGWVPDIGLFAIISAHFPDGKVRKRWRAVDWLAIGGSALFALGIALEPPQMLLDFLPIPGAKVALLSRYFQSPLPLSIPTGPLAAARGTGVTLVVMAYVGAAALLVSRFRRAQGDVRLQLKWFAYSATLFAATVVYAGIAVNVFSQPLYLALTPTMFAGITLPPAIGIAILRYRLYGINLIINRTLVYGSLTAILGALYIAVTTFLQRLFISASGQKSDAAAVLTAFVVVAAFSPIRDALQKRVDRRLGRATASAALEQFRADVESVVSVMDVHRVACRLVDQAVMAFDARGAAVYLLSSEASDPAYSRGRVNGEPSLEVPLRHEGRQLGRLVLGSRRGGVSYTERDREALQRSADSVGEALALAAYLGHRPLRTSR